MDNKNSNTNLIAGIDEAGRGPVIGPMVIACVAVEEKDLEKLENMGLKDSKLLSPIRREELFDIMVESDYIKYEISIIYPGEIDEALNSENFNLNILEAMHSAMVLNKIKPNKAILDLPSNNRLVYEATIRKFMKIKIDLKSEHKADMNYPIVSAASILAKVTRDREIEKIKDNFRLNFGSGYPSDPKTRKFLEESFKDERYKDIFRKTWSSYKKLAGTTDDKKQSSLSNFTKTVSN